MRRTIAVFTTLVACGKPSETTRHSEGKQAAPTVLATVPTPNLVHVEEGWFISGCAVMPPSARRWDAIQCVGANPPRRLWVSPFDIDVLETTVGDYARCVAAGACTPTDYVSIRQTDRHPAFVSYEQAGAYCAWRSMRLPTEAEWEKAARGTDGRMYPWGNTSPDCRTAALFFDPVDGLRELRCRRRGPEPVGTYSTDKSPYGALDMAGNAPEWTGDLLVRAKGEWKDYRSPGVIHFADPNVVDPIGPTREARDASYAEFPPSKQESDHVMRGGYLDAAVGTRSPMPTTWGGEDVNIPVAGIRCVKPGIAKSRPDDARVTDATISVETDKKGVVRITSSAL